MTNIQYNYWIKLLSIKKKYKRHLLKVYVLILTFIITYIQYIGV